MLMYQNSKIHRVIKFFKPARVKQWAVIMVELGRQSYRWCGRYRLNYNFSRAIRLGYVGTACLALCMTGSACADGVDDRDTARDLLAFVIFTEARGESWQGMHAVASVILNRALYRDYAGLTEDRAAALVRVVTKSKQFSGLEGRTSAPGWFVDPGDMLPGDLSARHACYVLADRLISGRFVRCGYWTHYYNTDLVAPFWAKDLFRVSDIGRYRFGVMPRRFW